MESVRRTSNEHSLPLPFFSQRAIGALFLANAAFSLFAFTFPLQSRAISIITAGINLVGAYVVFYKIFPPAPTQNKTPLTRMERILVALDEIAIVSRQKEDVMFTSFIQSLKANQTGVSIFDLLKGISLKPLDSISAYQKLMGCCILLTSLLVNTEEQAILSVAIFKRVFQEYVSCIYTNKILDQLHTRCVIKEIQNLIPKLVTLGLEKDVLEIVSIWNGKVTTIHKAPLSWFQAWLQSMMSTYGKEKVQAELDLEAWASEIRELPQPDFNLTKPSPTPFVYPEDDSISSLVSSNCERLLKILRYKFNIRIARDRCEDWTKIEMAASPLENKALAEEARTNQEKFNQYYTVSLILTIIG